MNKATELDLLARKKEIWQYASKHDLLSSRAKDILARENEILAKAKAQAKAQAKIGDTPRMIGTAEIELIVERLKKLNEKIHREDLEELYELGKSVV